MSSFGSRLLISSASRSHAGHGGDVDRQRDAFAVIFGRELACGSFAGRGLARGDVDLRRPLAEKSGGDHLADV